MKKIRVLILALAILALSAGTVLAETYIEGYIGNNFTLTAPNPLSLDVNPAFRGPTTASLEFPRTFSTNLFGGGKLGTWFSKQGFPGFDYPDWMKYFGFYLDFNYHGIDVMPGIGSRRMYLYPSNYPFFQHYKFYGQGSITTIGFMFAVRYGFNPTKNVPFGKIQPYLAVGPAIMITSFQPTLVVQQSSGGFNEVFPTTGTNLPNKSYNSYESAVSLGLETELGLRWMLTKFFSLETSFKYRYTRPSLTYDANILGVTHQLTYAPQFNLLSIQMGAAYHF